jgi:hypothetical protein
MNLQISCIILINIISLLNSQQLETKLPDVIQNDDINREIVFLEDNEESELDSTPMQIFIGEETSQSNVDTPVPVEKKGDLDFLTDSYRNENTNNVGGTDINYNSTTDNNDSSLFQKFYSNVIALFQQKEFYGSKTGSLITNLPVSELLKPKGAALESQPSLGKRSNPHQISASALQVMGMDAEQLSNILSMIGGPEQSNVQWWLGVDRKNVYGYCENINDGRGVTVGLSGFVTKWGEAQKLVKAGGGGSFDVNQCAPRKSCPFCDWVRANGNNQKFIDAQWNSYVNNFMKLVPKYIPSQFKGNALIKGMMLDLAMNAGEFKEGNAWGLKEVTQAAKGNDQRSWANSFLDARYSHFTAGNSQSMRAGRIDAWRKLVQDNQWDMRINACKYAWCSGYKCLGC